MSDFKEKVFMNIIRFKNKTLISLGLMALFLSGCASLIDTGETNQVSIGRGVDASYPYEIVDISSGDIIARGTTPDQVNLKRSDGFFSPGEYKINVDGPNGKVVTTVSGIPSYWYLFGNMFSTGPIGWFIVDPITGSMYRLKPNEVQVK